MARTTGNHFHCMSHQSVLGRSGNGLFMFMALTVSALLFSFASSASSDITPQEINSKECQKYVDSLFDSFPEFPKSKYLTKEAGILNCTNEMNDNYKHGLPNYATNTPGDVAKYREEKRKQSAMGHRAKNKDTVERIARSCARPILTMYVGLYAEKSKGASKQDQVKFLRSKLHSVESKTLLDGILIELSYKAVDEIYSKTGPTTDAEVADRVVAFHEKCREMYEEMLFLR